MGSVTNELATGVHGAFRAVPLHSSAENVPLRLCVIARNRPDPVTGNFVLLRDLADASVFLGCILDASGRVWDWIELWVQNPDKLHTSLSNLREHLSNSLLDARWIKLGQTFAGTDPENCLATGWEQKHPAPIYLDVALNAAVPALSSSSGRAWKLCDDDAWLRAAGLPPYSTSLFRYLREEGAEKTPLMLAVSEAPENDQTVTLKAGLKNADQLLPFNPQCGLMLARSFAPIPFEDYVGVLSGKPWEGVEPGESPFLLSGPYRALENPATVQQSGAHLFLGAHGRAGRLLETFHLKLQLFADTVSAVREFVQRQQLPFLNLSADSFRVKLNTTGAGLPFLWTAQTMLARPSQGFALPVETSDFRYFIPARASAASIYLPEGAGQPIQGTGTVRLRKVVPPERGQTVIEGTLIFQDRISVSQNDLIWIRLMVQNARVDLYGHLYSSEGLAQGEARFRTVPQKLPDATVQALRAAEGVSFARTAFDIVPLMSSPCDLYSLGVLATRTLLVNEENTLAVALDELLSLARQLRVDHDPAQELKWRVRRLFDQDERWMKSLGPHRLFWNGITPAEATAIMPIDLWCEALGIMVRLFPGAGPDSICRDFGDAPSLALETVFASALADLERLLRRSRSLIVIDWKFNREIHGVISGFLEKV